MRTKVCELVVPHYHAGWRRRQEWVSTTNDGRLLYRHNRMDDESLVTFLELVQIDIVRAKRRCAFVPHVGKPHESDLQDVRDG